MQTVSNTFNAYAKANVRPINYRVFISFAKDYDAAIDFFTLDSSALDGTDILRGVNSVVQEWDKYTYVEYSNRLINVEWQREQTNPWSVTLGIADVTFDNHDDFFTTGSGSLIDGNILPRRPIKIFSGFGRETIPQFIGLTEGLPKLDEKQKTATFHCVDFLSFIFNYSLDSTALFTNQRVDQIVSSLLQGAGLSPTQMNLDVAYTTIPYAFFDKGAKLGDALNQLMQAELGRLYMDENGMIQFDTRQSFSESSVYTFDQSNVKDFTTKQLDEISNVVEVKSKVLEAQANQKVFELSQPTLVSVGQSIDIWADFQDPVTSIDTPVYITSATTSNFTTNTAEDGSGTAYTDISLSAHSLFSKSYKMTFQNTGASDAYIRTIELHGIPVKPIADIYERQEVSASVSKYEERVMTIENKFIQTSTAARSLAILISVIYADLSGVSQMDAKGNPALQVNDPVTVNVTDDSGAYYISKIINKISKGSYEQTLQVQRRLSLSLFTLDSSALDGADVLGV